MYYEKKFIGNSMHWKLGRGGKTVVWSIEEIADKLSEEVVNNLELKNTIKDLEKKLSEAENPWISVKDRLPNHVNEVLMCDGDGYIEMGFCSNTRWFAYERPQPLNITHWMPLPNPPKQSEGGED